MPMIWLLIERVEGGFVVTASDDVGKIVSRSANLKADAVARCKAEVEALLETECRFESRDLTEGR